MTKEYSRRWQHAVKAAADSEAARHDHLTPARLYVEALAADASSVELARLADGVEAVVARQAALAGLSERAWLELTHDEPMFASMRRKQEARAGFRLAQRHAWHVSWAAQLWRDLAHAHRQGRGL